MKHTTAVSCKRSRILNILCLFLILCSIFVPPESATAGINQWTSTGPDGATILTIAIAPSSPSTLYAGTNGKGVFKSTNGGGDWFPVNLGVTLTATYAIAVDKNNPDIVYAGTFKSTDGGSNWTNIGADLTNKTVTSYAIHPTNPSIVYAGTQGGIFKSANGGVNWSDTGSTVLKNASVNAIVIDPAATDTLYAAVGRKWWSWSSATTQGVFKSTDGGQIWSDISTGITMYSSSSLDALAIDPSNPSILYCGGYLTGFWKSIDKGSTWTRLYINGNDSVQAIAINPVYPQMLYIGTSFSLHKTTDGGDTITSVNTLPQGWGSNNVGAIAINPVSNATVYVGTQGALYKSSNSGGAWVFSAAGIHNARVQSLAIDPVSKELYAGSIGAGVSRSSDGSATWNWASSGLASGDIYAVAVAPTSPATIFAGTDNALYRSTDKGGRWSAADIGPLNQSGIQQRINSIVVDPKTPATVYAGTFQGVLKSTNTGVSWSKILSMEIGRALAVDPIAPSTLYAGVRENASTNAGQLYKSTNGGDIWSVVPSIPVNIGVAAIAVDPVTPGTLYVALHISVFSDEIYKSTDYGTTWTKTGMAAWGISSITIDAGEPLHIYATSIDGVLKSENAGITAGFYDTGLSSGGWYSNSLVIMQGTQKTFYASQDGGGVSVLTEVRNVIISVSPDTIDLGRVAFGKSASGIVSISNSGYEPLVIKSFSLSVSGGSVSWGFNISPGGQAPCNSSWIIDPGATCTMDMKVTPYASTFSTINFKLIVTSNAANLAEYSVPVIVTPYTPSLSFSPSPLDFGETANNATKIQQVTITNTDSLPAVVNAPISVTGYNSSMFSVAAGGSKPCSSLTPSLAAGENCTVNVTFTPLSNGFKMAVLSLSLSSPSVQTSELSLYGVGVTPVVNGVCGSSSGGTLDAVPSANLCTSGTPSAVTGTGTLIWQCLGSGGGTNDICSATVPTHQFSITVSGTGSGIITSTPVGIVCTSDICQSTFNQGYLFSLLQTPGTTSTFGGWSGACTGTDACNVTMNAVKAVAATFTAAPRAKIGSTAYSSLSAACADAATDGSIILAMDTDFTENLTLNSAKSLILKGGYMADYSGKSGLPTMLNGVLRISNGTIKVESLAVR